MTLKVTYHELIHSNSLNVQFVGGKTNNTGMLTRS